MKKIVLVLIGLFSAVLLSAQEYDTIKLPDYNREKITITSELAKELLLYSSVSITDSALIGESNYYCLGDCDENYQEGSYYSKYAISSYVNGYAIIVDVDSLAGYDSPYWALRDPDREYALVNQQKKICIPFKKFDMIANGVYEGLVSVCINKKTQEVYNGFKYEKDNRKWGFAAPDGTVKIKLQYEDVRHFSEGLAAVKKDGLWGYIDKSDKVVIPFKYTYAGDFKRGVAMVNTDAIVDPKGEIIKDHTSYTNNKNVATGLIDHLGHTTFDILVEKELIKEYEGPYTDEKTNLTGRVKYTYYEDEKGARVKHGYYIFYSDYYRVDGHYKNGKRFGQWVEEWGDVQITSVIPFAHPGNDCKKIVSVFYKDGVPCGDFSYNMAEGECCLGDYMIFGVCNNEKTPFDEVRVNNRTYKLDKQGAITGAIEYEDYGSSSGIPIKVSMRFYKGVPMKVEEYDESTGKRKVLFQYDGFTTVDDIKEVVSDGIILYKVGDFYYELEPKDPLYPFDLFDVDKYPRQMREDMSFLLNLPASWPIKEIKSPQLNFFKKASREKIKSLEYAKYSNIFDSYSEYSQAYDLGEALFHKRVDEKLIEKRDAAYDKNKHLFLDKKEFTSYYSQGEEVFNDIVNKRNNLYNDYKKKDAWFADFIDYLNCTQRGSVDDEINVRRTVYMDDKNYFTSQAEFIKFYVQGKNALTAEIDRRQEAFGKCKKPYDNGNLFEDMSEFLPYYVQGNHIKEYAIRRFKYRLNDFVSLNLKDAKDSKKEDVKQFLAYLAECKAISNDAYPQMIEILVNKNSKMIKEWNENGEFFVNEVEFYEAYISNDYKTILKNKKNK